MKAIAFARRPGANVLRDKAMHRALDRPSRRVILPFPFGRGAPIR